MSDKTVPKTDNPNPKSYKYLFGPVPSRRLGLSLGIDIVPLKTCTQNCIYCQLGINGLVTLKRKEYVPAEEVIAEIRDAAAGGIRADYLTISGSGEPTLNSQIGYIIDHIRKITDTPVAVITNGTLFTDLLVRKDCAKADVVMPSLDGPDQATFQKINCPHGSINFDDFVEGLCCFRTEYRGQLWLEIFFVEGVNTSDRHIASFRSIIGRINPDRIHLNTAVRPSAMSFVVPVSPERLAVIARALGPNAEVITEYRDPSAAGRASYNTQIDNTTIDSDRILEMLMRRPCSLEDICSSIGINPNYAAKILAKLTDTGRIITLNTGGKKFFAPR